MGEFLVEIVGRIFEGLFDRPRRGVSACKPMLDYRQTFVVRKSKRRLLRRSILLAVIWVIAGVVMAFFDRAIEILPFFLAIGAGILLVYAAVNRWWRIRVTEERLVTYRAFGRDTVLWSDIALVRVIRTVHVRTVEIVLRDHEGYDVLWVDTEHTNTWYLVRMAEEKGIEMREELQSVP